MDGFNLTEFLPYELALLSERVSHRLAVEYEDLQGLTVAEWRVLVHVQRLGTSSIREIHTLANLDKPKVSRAVVRLVNAGLLAKAAHESDGRLVNISLTQKGNAALSEILPAVLHIEDRILAALSDDERATLKRAMSKIHQVLDKDPKARTRSPLDKS